MQPPALAINKQARDLRDALLAAFDLGSLTQLVFFDLGQTLANIVNVNQPFEDVTFGLINWAGQNGTTAALVLAMQQARPKHPLVLAYCQRYGAPAAVTA